MKVSSFLIVAFLAGALVVGYVATFNGQQSLVD